LIKAEKSTCQKKRYGYKGILKTKHRLLLLFVHESLIPSFPSTSLLPGRPNTEGTSNELSGSSLSTHSTVTTTLPPSSGCTQHVLQHGSSAENLHASAQQRANTRFDSQKGAPQPNGTLKKLKTGKEQVSSRFSLYIVFFSETSTYWQHILT
jgi:hypothetical protein